MTPTTPKDKEPRAREEKAEQRAEVEQQAVIEPREVVVSVDVTCVTDSDQVTDEAIEAAAAEQVTLPTALSVSGTDGRFYQVAVKGAALEPPEEPLP
jgi:hypothetical protein